MAPESAANICGHPANVSGPCLWGSPAKVSGGTPTRCFAVEWILRSERTFLPFESSSEMDKSSHERGERELSRLVHLSSAPSPRGYRGWHCWIPFRSKAATGATALVCRPILHGNRGS